MISSTVTTIVVTAGLNDGSVGSVALTVTLSSRSTSLSISRLIAITPVVELIQKCSIPVTKLYTRPSKAGDILSMDTCPTISPLGECSITVKLYWSN